MDTDDRERTAFHDVIERVMPLIYDQLREEAQQAGRDIHARLERFATHEHYQRVRKAVEDMLAHLRADALVAEFVLTRVLPAHRPALH